MEWNMLNVFYLSELVILCFHQKLVKTNRNERGSLFRISISFSVYTFIYFFVHSAFVSGSEELQQISYENNENATNIAIVYKEKYLILLPRIYLPSLIVQSLFLSKVDEKFFRLAYRNDSVVILESR